MLSLSQKLKILPITITIKTLWFIDLLGDLPEKMFFVLLSISAAGALFVFSHSVTFRSLKYVPDALTYEIYGAPSMQIQSAKTVLGANTKREFPYQAENIPLPVISAKAVIVVDVNTNKVLFELNSEEKLAPASTTKLMTALVALDLYNTEEDLEVPSFCTTIEGSKAGFSEGEKVKASDLLKALLISSSGDAACTLATGKTSYSEFVEKMNTKASELGMNNTFFTNPVGLDSTDGSHYSTAKDLYTLSRKAMSNELIRNSVKTKEIEIGVRKITSTNKLLWEIPETIGIKTGTTAAAGEVLIYEYSDEIKNIEIIVMGSTDRFADTKALLTWTEQGFVWK